MFTAVALGLALGQPTWASAGEAGPSVVYLLRHAEPVYQAMAADAPKDPPLNVMGQDRAEALARLLSSEQLDGIFSSDYARTRESVAPLAAAHGLAVEIYDAHDLEALAARLKATPGRLVVSGHSNTTGEVVALLGGDPGPPIDHEEYDRLYVLSFDAAGNVTTVVLRYGAPVPEDWRDRAAERR